MTELHHIGKHGPNCEEISLKLLPSGVYSLEWKEGVIPKRVFMTKGGIISMANHKLSYTDLRNFLTKHILSGEIIK